MGTVARLELFGAGPARFQRALEQVRAVYDSVNVHMNTWDPASEISRLNRAPADSVIQLSPGLSDCLHRAEDIKSATAGAFEPTAEPLMRLWGFYRRQGRLPEAGEVQTALASLGRYEHDSQRRRLTKLDERTAFDLGGIAKGYAVDLAAAALRSLGLVDALVDLGGNLYCLGSPPNKSAWRVGIKDPQDPSRLFASIHLRDGAVATSGSYERFVRIGGRRFGHIMNPRTGRPAEGLLSATVIADEATLCDALATALFVMGPEAALELLAVRFPQVQAILVLPAADQALPRVLASLRLEGNLELLPEYRDHYELEFF